jgi:hypothetical protein
MAGDAVPLAVSPAGCALFPGVPARRALVACAAAAAALRAVRGGTR